MMKKKKLSTAMLAGWKKVKKQAFGQLFRNKDSACALGCAYIGFYGKMATTDSQGWDGPNAAFPRLSLGPVRCLPEIEEADLNEQIYSCNDDEKMSIPAIAKGLKECGL